MSLVFEPFTRKALKAQPKQYVVDGQWRIDYLAFSDQDGSESTKGNSPLVIVEGAFQSFASYRHFVEKFLPERPVILVDLPSLGSNEQLAEDVAMKDMAQLLFRFVDDNGLSIVSVIGLSLAASIAASFAYEFPEHCEKLVLAGFNEKPRKSWRMLLSESLDVLNKDRLEEFGTAVVLYLINHNRLDETGITETARNLFQHQLHSATENDQRRYQINAKRLLEWNGLEGYPECPTLVCTGEYDTFTLPYEHALFADQCSQGIFALIENADHLPQFERRDETLELFSCFLGNKALDSIEGVKTFSPGTYTNLERRGEPRYIPSTPWAVLHSDSVWSEEVPEEELLHDVKVKIRNINFFGCLIEVEQEYFNLIKHARDVTITLQEPNISFDLLVFDQATHNMRCLFKHSDFQKAMQFKDLLDNWDYFTLPGADKDEGLSDYLSGGVGLS